MVGNNEIILSGDCMIAAMQEWIDAHMKDSLRVTDVNYNAKDFTFSVSLSAPKIEEAD